MKYLFADSTEFALQKDFLGLLDNFVDTSVKTISLENTVFDLKEKIRDRRMLKNSVIDEMDNFLITVDKAISEAVEKSIEKETIVKHADKSKYFLKKYIEEGKTKFHDEIFHEIAGFEEKIDKADEENRKILEPFFIKDPIPILDKRYTLKALKKGYSAKVQAGYEGGISSEFEIASSELPFWDSHVKVSDFVKDVEVPVRMKKPLLKKETVPEIINIDDYYLTNLVQSGNYLEVIFRKKLSVTAERLIIKMDLADNSSIEIYYAEENDVEKDVLAVPELKSELNAHQIHELGEKIIERTDSLYLKKQTLVSLHLNEKDVFGDNLLLDLMQTIAKIFAPTIGEIKKRSSSKEELSLKVEDDTGKRSEIYLKKAVVEEKLGKIKEKGNRLLEVLDI